MVRAALKVFQIEQDAEDLKDTLLRVARYHAKEVTTGQGDDEQEEQEEEEDDDDDEEVRDFVLAAVAVYSRAHSVLSLQQDDEDDVEEDGGADGMAKLKELLTSSEYSRIVELQDTGDVVMAAALDVFNLDGDSDELQDTARRLLSTLAVD